MKCIFWIAAICLAAGAATAQIATVGSTQPAERKQPAQRVVKMNVTPAPEPVPALAWRLLPTAGDETPGDAATLWLMAISGVQQLDSKQEQIRQFLDQPAAELRPDAVRQALPGLQGPYAPMSSPGYLRFSYLAARRNQCNWELTFRSDGFYATLPHLSNSRNLARVLALKARMELRDGRINDAMESLQTGYSLARDLNNEAVLVQSLVGAAVAQAMNREVEQIIGQPNSPNLYWALAHLPRPFLDVQAAFESELLGIFGTMPQLKDIRQRTITAEEFKQVMRIIPSLQSMTGEPQGNNLGGALMMAWMYPEAKAYVAAQDKLTPEQVEAMPAHQVLARYIVGTYEQWWGEMSKWGALPYWQAQAGMREASRKLREMKKSNSPLLALVPAVEAAYTRLMEVDRQIATLQCIEAIRAYAAEHNGTLPAKLQDITGTPAPIDPATGAMFIYEVKGDTAILDAPAPPGERADRGWRYEITIVK